MYPNRYFDHGFPVGLLARMLHARLGTLQTVCFQDNEYGGDEVRRKLTRTIVLPINAKLRRLRKGVTLVSVTPCDKRHHRMKVLYHLAGAADASEFVVTLFPPSQRQLAAERDGKWESGELSGPSRGADRDDD